VCRSFRIEAPPANAWSFCSVRSGNSSPGSIRWRSGNLQSTEDRTGDDEIAAEPAAPRRCIAVLADERETFRPLENVAVVIGDTGVLGGAVAETLAVSGAAVAIGGRNEERGHARCVAIRSGGGTAEYIATDASSRQSLSALNKTLTSRLGLARSW
jgi:hypothetical protein